MDSLDAYRAPGAPPEATGGVDGKTIYIPSSDCGSTTKIPSPPERRRRGGKKDARCNVCLRRFTPRGLALHVLRSPACQDEGGPPKAAKPQSAPQKRRRPSAAGARKKRPKRPRVNNSAEAGPKDGAESSGGSSRIFEDVQEGVGTLEQCRDELMSAIESVKGHTIPEHLMKTLLPFQLRGVARVISKFDGTALLADEMGLGKTLEALAVAAVYRAQWPLLIVCPAAVRCAWAEQVETWIPFLNPSSDILIFRSQADAVEAGTRVCVVSYRMLSACHAEFSAVRWRYIIIDESQSLKRFSFRTQSILRLVFGDKVIAPSLPKGSANGSPERVHPSFRPSRGPMSSPRSPPAHRRSPHFAPRRRTKRVCKPPDLNHVGSQVDVLRRGCRLLLLSGTPCLDRPIDLYYQLALLCPEKLRKSWPTHESFGQHFCRKFWFRLPSGVSQWQWGLGVKKRMPELHAFLTQTCLVRRLKRQVMATALPAKTRTLIRVRVPGLDRTGIQPDVLVSSPQRIARRLERLGTAKIPFVNARVVQLLEQTAEKIIIFAYHISVVDAVLAHVQKKLFARGRGEAAVCLKGETSPDARHKRALQFTHDASTRVAVVSLRAAGSGVDLAVPGTVIFAELGWTPSELVQAEDRVHRCRFFIFITRSGFYFFGFCRLTAPPRVHRYNAKLHSSRHGKISTSTPAACDNESKSTQSEPSDGPRVRIEYICAEGTDDDAMLSRVQEKSRRLSILANGKEESFHVSRPDVMMASHERVDTADTKHEDVMAELDQEGLSPEVSKITQPASTSASTPTSITTAPASMPVRFIVSGATGRLHITDVRGRCFGSLDMALMQENRMPLHKMAAPLREIWAKVAPTVTQFARDWDAYRPAWRQKLKNRLLSLPLDSQLVNVALSADRGVRGVRGMSCRRWSRSIDFARNAPEGGCIVEVPLQGVGQSHPHYRHQIRLSDGTPLCLYCRVPMLATQVRTNSPPDAKQPKRIRDLLCSRECYLEYSVRVGSSSVVRARLVEVERG